MKKKIFALGFFDGVHRGHQALLAECVALADDLGAQPAAITFEQHPKSLFTPTPPALINSNADRDALLRRYGMAYIHHLPVNKDVMSTSWQNFLENLLDQGACGFVCGDDFRFGFRGEGDHEKLAQFCADRGLPCRIVAEQTLDGLRISSSQIRQFLLEGRLDRATEFLGHRHMLSGPVVHGRQLGRTIGVPTANVQIPEGVIVPKQGVYACICRWEGKAYRAVTNVGSRPTVDGHQVRTESWILDFEGDLYGQKITLEFHKFLRPEEKFADLQALKAQIQRDAEECRMHNA